MPPIETSENIKSVTIARLTGLLQKISTPPMDDTELGTQKFQDFQKHSSSLCRIPYPADSESWGIPEFFKILNGFPGIPGKFMEFLSGSPSIYYRISNVVHGGVWIFSGIAHSRQRDESHSLLALITKAPSTRIRFHRKRYRFR